MAEGEVDRWLQTEYSQHRFVQTLWQQMRARVRRNLNQPLDRGRDSYIVSKSVFGRWLMTMQQYNGEQLDENYRLLPTQPLNDERSRTELARMLREELMLEADVAAEIADHQFAMIEQFLTEDNHDNGHLEPQYEQNDQGGSIAVRGFRTPHCPRIRYLVDRFGLMETAIVTLRYSSLSIFKGGESGMSVTVLNALHDIGQATYEGFASPLNCRLLGRPGVKFCSLFEDTDAAFGSMGNFFRINLADHPGGWILNPPFVEPVLEATARRVVDHLDAIEEGSFWFYITFPMWEDNEGWQMLDQSEWKVARLDFNQRTFVQQDWLGQVYTPTLRLCIFVLGKLPEDINIVDLRNRVSSVNEETALADWLEACSTESESESRR